MRIPISVLSIVILVGVVRADETDPSWQIRGQVVDEEGNPVEDFEAASFWTSNGNLWDKLEAVQRRQADMGRVWNEEGVLFARSEDKVERQPDGRFSLTISDRPQVSVFAVDKLHERGGFVLVDQSAADQPVTITLAPLVRVTCQVYCSEAGRIPDWSVVAPYPVGGNGTYPKFTLCGSVRGEISLLLPPGSYEFDVSSSSPDARLRIPTGQRGTRVEIPRGKSEFDLGVFDVALPRDKDGIARDYSQFYGKEPPELAITDARGVPKTVKLADFRGKWVLLDFWAVWCGGCVSDSLPKLTKFYEEHAADRDRFEILAICNTESEKAHTIAAYDALAAPLVKDIWGGKPLPFPVLVDGEGKTSEVYGIQGWPTVLLIDPEGHLVKYGDDVMLGEKLRERPVVPCGVGNAVCSYWSLKRPVRWWGRRVERMLLAGADFTQSGCVVCQ